MSKTVGIIGLGLLGGSLAKALKEYTEYEVVGYARRQEVCDAAIQDGVVKAAWTEVEPLIKNSDIVVFSCLLIQMHGFLLKRLIYLDRGKS